MKITFLEEEKLQLPTFEDEIPKFNITLGSDEKVDYVSPKVEDPDD